MLEVDLTGWHYFLVLVHTPAGQLFTNTSQQPEVVDVFRSKFILLV